LKKIKKTEHLVPEDILKEQAIEEIIDNELVLEQDEDLIELFQTGDKEVIRNNCRR
jgi:hypothetical protein